MVSHILFGESHSAYMRMYTGYTPFDRDTQEQEMQAIIAGDYAFEPGESICIISIAPLTSSSHSGVLAERFGSSEELRHRLSHHRSSESSYGQGGVAAQMAGVRSATLRRRHHGRAEGSPARDPEGLQCEEDMCVFPISTPASRARRPRIHCGSSSY